MGKSEGGLLYKLRHSPDYTNWKQAVHCSIALLGIYTALFSAQNTQSQLFESLGYNNLGLVSNSVDYIGQGFGSIISILLVHRFGIVKAMSYAALLSIPFIISLIFPTLSRDHQESTSFIFTPTFVWIANIATNLVSGFGQGIAQPASGTFISDCATESSKGIFFAFSWACYMGS